jgi:hypothetical protein
MNKLFALLPFLLALAAGTVQAQSGTVDVGSDPARAIAGRDLTDNDARLVQARARMKKVVEMTGETDEFVAASCMKLSRFIKDGLNVKVTPAEVLEGVNAQTVPGKALSDMTAAYFAALRGSANKTHAEAMAALKK